MPSGFPKVISLLSFATAVGLAVTDGGAVLRDRLIELAGLPLVTLGGLALLIAVARQVAAMARRMDACREQIQGEAFAQAIELWRSGNLTGSSTGGTFADRPNSE